MQDSPLVELLLKLGAVIYVKTNVPQTLMVCCYSYLDSRLQKEFLTAPSQSSDSQNNIFGRTLNPLNTMLGPGGSSGGEGALIALRGSPLGVGTDIGGRCHTTEFYMPRIHAKQKGSLLMCFRVYSDSRLVLWYLRVPTQCLQNSKWWPENMCNQWYEIYFGLRRATCDGHGCPEGVLPGCDRWAAISIRLHCN